MARARFSPADQAALAEAVKPFADVVTAYGRSQPAPDHVVLRVHGPKGARAEVPFSAFLALVALAPGDDPAVAESPMAADSESAPDDGG